MTRIQQFGDQIASASRQSPSIANINSVWKQDNLLPAQAAQAATQGKKMAQIKKKH